MSELMISELKEKLTVPVAISFYPGLAVYRHSGYEIEYSPKIEITGKNYHDSKAQLTDGTKFSKAADELAIQLGYEKAGIDPRSKKAKAFNDIFGRNKEKIYAWQWTDTFLRIPSNKLNPEKPDYIDKHGRKFWAREWGLDNEIYGVVYIPEGGGRVVPKTKDFLDVYDLITGLPRITSDNENDMKYENHTLHFRFNSKPSKDSKSGHYDVAVGRRSDWRRAEDERCLYVSAYYERSYSDSRDGFRPVWGSVPEIEVVSSNVDLEKIRREILQKARGEFETDIKKLPFPELLEKYKLL